MGTGKVAPRMAPLSRTDAAPCSHSCAKAESRPFGAMPPAVVSRPCRATAKC